VGGGGIEGGGILGFFRVLYSVTDLHAQNFKWTFLSKENVALLFSELFAWFAETFVQSSPTSKNLSFKNASTLGTSEETTYTVFGVDFMYCIQHYFVRCLSDSTVSEDAETEPRGRIFKEMLRKRLGLT
jgi:hypothetical protein